MLIKLVSLLASILLLFSSPSSLPEMQSVHIEKLGSLSEFRTADEINGASGTRFYIERPSDEKLHEVNAEIFGLSSENEDNFSAFQRALDYCAENPKTKLVINKGVYSFTTPATLIMNGCRDILVEGNGATFVFSYEGYRISVLNCDGIEFRNLKLDWDWESKPLASVVSVANASPDSHTLDLVFKDCDYVDENMALMTITQCDPETFTFGAKKSGKEVYLYQDVSAIQSVQKQASDTLRVTHNGCMDNFENGETYIIRHFVYGGAAFQLSSYSKNITFNSVSIYSGVGMAFVCEGNSSHFQIVDSFIGVNPEYADERFVSVTADAIHIVNTDGCFNISGCDISRMGDDAVNVHDGLGYVSSFEGRTLCLIASAMRLQSGDTLGFKNIAFENTDFTAKIVAVRSLDGITKEVVLDRDLPAEFSVGFVAYSKECDSGNYVIRDNYFHEHRARGLLLQSSNGLCENNRFYKTMGQAIKVIMDIQPTLWQEGTGVNNLIIRNNTFEMCNYSDWGTLIEIGSNIAGKKAETTVFTNIEISSNTFSNFPSKVMTVNNVNNLVFRNNTIDAGESFGSSSSQGKISFDKFCSNVIYSGNVWEDAGFLKVKKIAEASSVKVWAQVNSQL